MSYNPNIPNLIMMIRPKSFGFNRETADSNHFQQSILVDNPSLSAQKEFDEMVRLLEQHQIKVKQFDDVLDNLPDTVFSNNWISHFPSGEIVVYPMLTENRRKEVRPDIIDWMKRSLIDSTIIDLSERANMNQFLEGTGSIVFDHQNKFAYACSSPRTDFDLLKELCTALDYKVIRFRSIDRGGDEIYHTNVMMTIADQYAIVCLESIPNGKDKNTLRSSIIENEKEMIVISQEQLLSFAGNAFEVVNELNESCLLLSRTAYDSLVPSQIAQINKYSKILPINIQTIEKIGGGSVRCMSTGLFDYPR